MARFAVSCKVNADDTAIVGVISDVVNTVATTAVNTDVATLVADGITPTQAHVTTLNTDWTTLKAGTGAIPTNEDVILSFDAAVITTRTKLRQAVQALLTAIDGGIGGLSA